MTRLGDRQRRRHGWRHAASVVAALTLGAAGVADAAQEGTPPAERPAAPANDAVVPSSVTAYGTAVDHGPPDTLALAAPLTGVAPTPTGDGYWLAASDGGVFTFGDATFAGSAGAIDLAAPIVGIAAHPDGDGYWLAASDGGVFSFGGADYHGSMGGKPIDSTVLDIASSPDGDGYWLTTATGEVFGFGVIEHGSAAEADPGPSQARTVAIAAHPGGDGYWLAHGQLPVLEVHDRGAAVESLQRRLDQLGYWVGPIDGIYGELTEQAVYAFQKYQGLPIDGRAGDATRRAIEDADRPVPRTDAGDGVEVDKTRQLLFFVEDGRARWVFNTSTGTEEPYTYEDERYLADTPPGRWTIYREVDGVRESNLGRLIRPKYFHRDGIAIHGSSFVPPYPASHGCVRVTLPAIDFIWGNELAPIDTDVWVYGTTPG